jgi:hypothetical protein
MACTLVKSHGKDDLRGSAEGTCMCNQAASAPARPPTGAEDWPSQRVLLTACHPCPPSLQAAAHRLSCPCCWSHSVSLAAMQTMPAGLVPLPLTLPPVVLPVPLPRCHCLCSCRCVAEQPVQQSAAYGQGFAQVLLRPDAILPHNRCDHDSSPLS